MYEGIGRSLGTDYFHISDQLTREALEALGHAVAIQEAHPRLLSALAGLVFRGTAGERAALVRLAQADEAYVGHARALAASPVAPAMTNPVDWPAVRASNRVRSGCASDRGLEQLAAIRHRDTAG